MDFDSGSSVPYIEPARLKTTGLIAGGVVEEPERAVAGINGEQRGERRGGFGGESRAARPCAGVS